MFKKAEIEIYDLKLNDIIVTSEIPWDYDDVFTEGNYPPKN